MRNSKKNILIMLITLGLVSCATMPNNSKKEDVRSDVSPSPPKVMVVSNKHPVTQGVSANKFTTHKMSAIDKGPKIQQKNLIAKVVRSQVGKPYRLGGNNPAQGFDCSGLVEYVYKHAGIDVPRTSTLQANYFKTTGTPEVGDVIFFKIGRSVSHSGIYIGNNLMVHSPSRGKSVEVTRIDQEYWRKHFYKYGKL